MRVWSSRWRRFANRSVDWIHANRYGESTRTSMSHQIDRLRARVSRAEQQRNEVITRHADALSHAISE